MAKATWKRHGGYEISPTRFPGVSEIRGGDFYVRARVIDPRTGKQTEIARRIEAVDASAASAWLEAERKRVREGNQPETMARIRFSQYAARLVSRKVAAGELKSPKTKERWRYTLEHHLCPAFGDFYMDAIDKALIEERKAAWTQATIPPRKYQKRPVVKYPRKKSTRTDRPARAYSPNTINGWLDVLRVIFVEATPELRLDVDPTLTVKNVDTSDWRTYSEEQPNSLRPDDVPAFLAACERLYPQHFAMVLLGIGTGLRPSSMRGLRRQGATPDLLWDEGVLLNRRSVTMGEAIERTKQRKDQKLHLPPRLMHVLRLHVMRLRERQQESDLLFPTTEGGYRTASVLDKPFRAIGAAVGLGYKVTPRAMRRTFDDLARRLKVADVVTKAVAGWTTGRMHDLYASVAPAEVKAAIGQVIEFALPAAKVG